MMFGPLQGAAEFAERIKAAVEDIVRIAATTSVEYDRPANLRRN